MKLRCTSLAATLVLALAAPALAQNTSAAAQASRRVLLDQAQAARAAGDHPHALDAAQRAGQIEMTPSVRLFIAEEQLELGQLAQAMGSADTCVREAQSAERVATRDVIVARCRDLVRDLRARVGFVTVRVGASRPEGLRVVVGGEVLPDVLLNAPSVATPGNVVIEATAPGFAPFRQTVAVVAGQSRDVTLALTPAAGGASSSAASSDGVSATGGPGASGPVDSGARTRRGLSPGPFVVMGVGVVGLALAPVFVALRDGAASGCTVDQQIACPDQASADRAQAAPGFHTAMLVSVIGGGAALAGGLVWLLVDMQGGGGGGARSHARIDVAPTAGGAMVHLGGVF